MEETLKATNRFWRYLMMPISLAGMLGISSAAELNPAAVIYKLPDQIPWSAPDARRKGAAGAEAEVVRDDDPEEQAEADDVQPDDRGGQAGRTGPLGRRQRAADPRQHASASDVQAGHRPAIGKCVKRAR